MWQDVGTGLTLIHPGLATNLTRCYVLPLIGWSRLLSSFVAISVSLSFSYFLQLELAVKLTAARKCVSRFCVYRRKDQMSGVQVSLKFLLFHRLRKKSQNRGRSADDCARLGPKSPFLPEPRQWHPWSSTRHWHLKNAFRFLLHPKQAARDWCLRGVYRWTLNFAGSLSYSFSSLNHFLKEVLLESFSNFEISRALNLVACVVLA